MDDPTIDQILPALFKLFEQTAQPRELPQVSPASHPAPARTQQYRVEVTITRTITDRHQNG